MSCLEVRALLPLRPLDVLEEDEVGLVAEHLTKCAACSTDAREHDAAFAVLTARRPGDEPREGAADRVWDKLLVEAARAPTVPAGSGEKPLALTISLSCSFCHDVLARNETCYCASCLAPHHDECFRTHGRCSAYGCEETRTVRPTLDVTGPTTKRAPSFFRGRRSLPGTLLSGAILLATGGLSAAALTRWAKAPTPRVDETVEQPSPGPAAVASGSGSRDVIPEIEADESDLRDVMRDLGRHAGKNIIVDDNVHEKVTISLRQIPWRDAVDVIAKMTKCDVRTLPGQTLLLEQPPKVTIQFTNTNARTVLHLLAAYSGKNIVVSPDCTGDVTLDLHGVHWLTALKAIAKSLHYHVLLHDDVVLVSAEPVRGEDETLDEEPFKLRFEIDPADTRRVDLVCEQRDLRDVCDDLGQTLGKKIVVEPDVHETVTANLHAAPWADVLLYLSRACKVTIEERGQTLVASQPPKATLQATDTPVALWFQLLAASAGENLVFVGDPEETVTLDLHAATFLEAIDLTAANYGYEVHREERGNLIRVTVDQPARARRTNTSKTVRRLVDEVSSITFRGGRQVEATLEAILLGGERDARSWAVISGRRYQVGEQLRDKQDQLVAVKVTRIAEGVVELEAFEDPGSPKVTLRLDTKKAPSDVAPGGKK